MKITHTINQDIEIDLSYIDDSELFEELEERGFDVVEEGVISLIEEIYNAKKLEKPYDVLLNKLIENTTGRIL